MLLRACVEHLGSARAPLPVSRMAGCQRRLRPEEGKHIDARRQDRLIADLRQWNERNVVNRMPGAVRARDTSMHEAAASDANADAASWWEVRPLEAPQHRIADLGQDRRECRPAGLVQGGSCGNDHVYDSMVAALETQDGLAA